MTGEPGSPMMSAGPGRGVVFRVATRDEFDAWDDLTVHIGGGHVYQSRAWAAHRALAGWHPDFLMGSDGSAVLALRRRWPIVGGSGAYLPRGPIPAGAAAAMAARLAGAATWLGEHGVDVIASDTEAPAMSGYPALVAASGFRAIPELQPSRHRMSLDLGGTADEEALRAKFSKSTRQRLAAAERDAIEVIRYDRRGGPADDLVTSAQNGADPAAAFDRFARRLITTGQRVGFRIGDVAEFQRWWASALAAGHLVFLEARVAGEPLGGLILYRHGGRLSTVHSADDPSSRGAHPGLMHLLRWRAIQLAVREGCAEMDLGGVDVAPDHAQPVPGSPTWGLYEHKRSFGAEWVQMTGAHERVLRPWRYGLGRVTGRLARMAGR